MEGKQQQLHASSHPRLSPASVYQCVCCTIVMFLHVTVQSVHTRYTCKINEIFYLSIFNQFTNILQVRILYNGNRLQ